jgi:hypothetical protein
MDKWMQFLHPGGHPGGHVVHHIHYVGPSGANGTQQFPKLTDCELCSLLKPLLQKSILCVYAVQSTEAKSAQNMLAHLLPIVKSGMEIFTQIEKQHGYCSSECIGAMQRVQTEHGGLHELVFEALIICLSFANLEIQICKAKEEKAEPRKDIIPVAIIDPNHTVFHQHSPKPTPSASQVDIEAMLTELHKITKREQELRELIDKHVFPP